MFVQDFPQVKELGKRFIHNGIVYDFKLAKLNYLLKRIPPPVNSQLARYISLVLSDEFPNELFNDPKIIRCSNFRIKYLKRGYRKIMEQRLIERGEISVYRVEPDRVYYGSVPRMVRELVDETNIFYNDRISQGYIKPGHEAILANAMLKIDGAFATEFPIWTKRQAQITDFKQIIADNVPKDDNIKKNTRNPAYENKKRKNRNKSITLDTFNHIGKNRGQKTGEEVSVKQSSSDDKIKGDGSSQDRYSKPEILNFNHSYSMTGHIDLLLYDHTENELIIADYKPEGNFMNSLPQIAAYGLMLKHIFNINAQSKGFATDLQVKCVSFNKMEAWYYDPEITRKSIEKELKLGGDPQTLRWRNYLRAL